MGLPKFTDIISLSQIEISKEILETETFSELIDYGNNPLPCSLIGYYLKMIGNILLRNIEKIMICF